MIPIQQALNGMVTIMLAKFMLNDVPHAAGIYEHEAEQQLTFEREIDALIEGLRPHYGVIREAIDMSFREKKEVGYLISRDYSLIGPFMGTRRRLKFAPTQGRGSEEEALWIKHDVIGKLHTHPIARLPEPSFLDVEVSAGLYGDEYIVVGSKSRGEYYLYVNFMKRVRSDIPMHQLGRGKMVRI